jgi:hypothetical protein
MTAKKSVAAKAPKDPPLRDFLHECALRCEHRVGDPMFRHLATEIVVDVRVKDSVLAAAREEGAARERLLDEALAHARRALALLALPASDPGYARAPETAMAAILAAERAYGVVLGDFTAEHASTGEYAKSTAARASRGKRKPRDEELWAVIRTEWNGGAALAKYKKAGEFDLAMCKKYGVTVGAVAKRRTRDWAGDRPKP